MQLQPHDQWTVQGEAFYKHHGRLLALDYGTLWSRADPPVANSVGGDLGLTTDQYLAGADRDGNPLDDNVRLGVNIFRILDSSKL